MSTLLPVPLFFTQTPHENLEQTRKRKPPRFRKPKYSVETCVSGDTVVNFFGNTVSKGLYGLVELHPQDPDVYAKYLIEEVYKVYQADPQCLKTVQSFIGQLVQNTRHSTNKPLKKNTGLWEGYLSKKV